MFGSRFNQAKCETTSRLCVGRIKLLRNKKNVMLKQSQRDIADLLRQGKQEYARIRVEGVIREKHLMQAYEILELYLELLTVRTRLIAQTKELPRDMMEAVSSIIYAAQRISDLPELMTLRSLFASKYGKEYAAEASADATATKWQVNTNLIACLLVEAPQPEEKLAMLSEIAQEYSVEWDLSAAARDMGVGAVGPSGQLPHSRNSEPAAAVAAGRYPSIFPSSIPMMPTLGEVHTQENAAMQYEAQVVAPAQPGATPVSNGTAAPQGWQPSQAVLVGTSHLPADIGQYTGPPPVVRSTPSPPQPPPQQPPSDEELASSPVASPPPPASSGGGASVASSVGGYLVRSDSEIQRAYDAAQGPPTKGDSAATAPSQPQPPLLAPVPAPSLVPVLPQPPAQPAPSPEKLQPPATSPARPNQMEDEYEELTRRLEALKRS